eukprot:COSAG06_NODE_6599_length_2859_cov_3.776087_1_plen_97_part_10
MTTVFSGARAFPGWARQASPRENCCAVLTACGMVGSCCGEMLGLSEASENEIERLRRRADETKVAMVGKWKKKKKKQAGMDSIAPMSPDSAAAGGGG